LNLLINPLSQTLGLKHFPTGSQAFCCDSQGFNIVLDQHLQQALQLLFDVSPLKLMAIFFEPAVFFKEWSSIDAGFERSQPSQLLKKSLAVSKKPDL